MLPIGPRRRLLLTVPVTALLAVLAPPVASEATKPVGPHLPTRVNAPGPWSDDETVDGPIAAVGIAMRREPRGLTDDLERLALFAVSATDGHSYWLPASDASLDDLALSPDGRYVAWARTTPAPSGSAEGLFGDDPDQGEDPMTDDEDVPPAADGFSLLDTRSGLDRQLAVPAGERYDLAMTGLAFSGDSRHLLASNGETTGAGGALTTDAAWDVATGRYVRLERPGKRSGVVYGSSPEGVVLIRGRDVVRREGVTGAGTTTRFATDVVDASWAPEGSGFAYIAAPRKGGDSVLHVGRDVAAARTTTVALADGPPGRIVGWRDADHVVVDHFRRDLDVVDVRDGSVRTIDLAGGGKQLNTPIYAADLWQAPLVDPPEREGLRDPRVIWRWAAMAGAVVLGVVVLRRIRVRP
ncbi:hypothetical protein [Nocardioides sp.]|uniref:hypothetical protein n=1 Tax=Nocardioides sp. TaxID=35761 RepID=UPI0035144CE1